MDENYAIRLNEAMSKLGIKYAMIEIDDTFYQYKSISPTRFVFGSIENVDLKEYSTEDEN